MKESVQEGRGCSRKMRGCSWEKRRVVKRMRRGV